MKKIQILLITSFLASWSIMVCAQITGPSPTYAGSTQVYTWTGSTLTSPVWQFGNGTKVSQSGNSVIVTWNPGSTAGAVILMDGAIHKGTLSITLTPSVVPITPTMSPATSLTPTSFTANWGSSPSSASYRLDVSKSSTFNPLISGYNNLLVYGTSKVISGLTGGGTFYYRVRAVNALGTSPNSQSSLPIILELPPPTNITAATYSTTIELSWNAVAEATAYLLDVATDPGFYNKVSGYNGLSITNTNRKVTGLTPSTNYWIRLRSKYGSTFSDYSDPLLVVTMAPPVITGPPPPIFAGGTYEYSWPDAPLVSPNWVVANGTKVSQTGNKVTVTWNTDAEGGAIVLIDDGAQKGVLDNIKFAPQAPLNLSATSITGSSFTANWESSFLALSYELDVSTSSSFDNFVNGYESLVVDHTSQVVSGLIGGGIFYYRVRAINNYGKSLNATSPPINVQLGHPISITITPHSYSLDLVWPDVAGANAYYLDVAKDPGFNERLDNYNGALAPNSNKVIEGLQASTPYWIRIRAFDGQSYSSYSDGVQGYTLDQFAEVNENYIVENTILVPSIEDPNLISSLSRDEVSQQVRYFDGLGRPLQTIITEGSPLKKDVVQPIAYDEFGREAVKYLPYAASERNGWIKEDAIVDQLSFYQSSDKVAIDAAPFAVTVFERSPLSRVIEQGSPGADWQPDDIDSYSSTDRTVKKAYELNGEGEVIKWFYIPPDETHPEGIVAPGQYSAPVFYMANNLYKNRTKDEHGHEVIEYMDSQGKLILKKVQASVNQWAETYYVYDDFGRLVAVLQPEAVRILLGN